MLRTIKINQWDLRKLKQWMKIKENVFILWGMMHSPTPLIPEWGCICQNLPDCVCCAAVHSCSRRPTEFSMDTYICDVFPRVVISRIWSHTDIVVSYPDAWVPQMICRLLRSGKSIQAWAIRVWNMDNYVFDRFIVVNGWLINKS